MNKALLSFLLFFSFQTIIAQNYSILTIPDSLKTNANAVVRLNQVSYNIHNNYWIEIKVKKVITILNKNAKELSYLKVHYNKYNSIISINGKIYDFLGNDILKISKKDLKDISYNSSFFDKERLKTYTPVITKYPFTVEYEYSIIKYNNFFSSAWSPYLDFNFNIGVENAFFTYTVEDTSNIRFLTTNIESKAQIIKTNLGTKYIWSFSNLKPLNYEYFSPPLREQLPNIRLAPNKIKLDFFKGSMASWSSMGFFLYNLNSERDKLSIEKQKIIKDLISNTTDTVEMIKLIYNYMQSKTRYVSIQLGIGSWQPFKASFVDEKVMATVKHFQITQRHY